MRIYDHLPRCTLSWHAHPPAGRDPRPPCAAFTLDWRAPPLRRLLVNLSVATKNRLLNLLLAMAPEMPIWVVLMSIGLFRKRIEYTDVALHRGGAFQGIIIYFIPRESSVRNI